MNALAPPPDRPRLRWPTATLSTYLVAVLLLATTPIAALMSYQLVRAVIDEQDLLAGRLAGTASSLSQSIERELSSSIDALYILSQSDSLQQGDVEAFHRSLTERALLRPTWGGAYLQDARGVPLFDGTGRNSGPADADARRVLASREPLVSDLDEARRPGRRTTTIKVPVLLNGEPRYVLGVWIDVSLWQRLIEQARGDAPGFTNLFDRQYRLIARTRSPERFVGQRLEAGTVAAVAAQPGGFGRVDTLESAPAYAAWRRVPRSDWGVAVAVDARPLEEAYRRAILIALGTVAACLLLSVTLALLVVRRVTRPLEQLATHGSSPEPAPLPVREFELLRDALQSAAKQDARVRDRLQTKADEFETLFESSPIGLAFAQDPRCDVVICNAALEAIVGPAGVTAQMLRDGVALEPHERPLQRAAALGEAVDEHELEIRIEGRAARVVIAQAVPLRDAAGRPRGALGALVDITARKQAESRLMETDRRLRESQRLVDLAQEAGHVGFFQYRFREATLAWTSGQAMLFGIDQPGSGHGLQAWGDRIDAEDREAVENTLREMFLARRENATVEFRVALPDDEVRWLSSRLLLTYDDDGLPLQMIGISVDMTEQKRSERERAALVEREQAARQEAERVSRAKDEFLAMLGHELRNPMSAIGSAVELLGRVPPQSDMALSARSIIERQTRHLAHLLDDLLDVGRVISGKILLARQRFDLAALAGRLVSTLQLTGVTARHDLHTDLNEVWVDADVTRIEQVVSNLLTNAGKYTPEGGRIEVDVRPAGEHGEFALLEVRDTGVGIPPELLPRIFELFVQGERSLDRRAGGLGVGLTLVRRLVELHGGTVEAASDGGGSTFRVRLAAQAPPPVPAAASALPASRRRRIAVIEDNEDALNALRSILELDGHSVSTANDGVSGLASLLELRPDIAIVDIGLPGLSGLQVALRSRAAGYPGRMIAISGYGQERDIRDALKSGFDAHMVKPIDAADLRRLIAEG